MEGGGRAAIIWIAIAVWPARVAARKGHSFIGNFVFSLIFFPLALLSAYLVQDRTAAQWKVVDVLRSVRNDTHGTHGSQKVAAQKLGITEQSVSRAVLRSGWQEEWAARPAAELLLTLAHDSTEGEK